MARPWLATWLADSVHKLIALQSIQSPPRSHIQHPSHATHNNASLSKAHPLKLHQRRVSPLEDADHGKK